MAAGATICTGCRLQQVSVTVMAAPSVSEFNLFLPPMSDSTHSHTILYAEDDADDLLMVKEALQRFDSPVHVLHAPDGFEALEKLKQAQVTSRLPCLIILDINMPGMDGREALVRIRQSEVFKKIPVVLFTTSSSDGDKNFARQWGAHFFTKPQVYSELEQMAGRFINLCEMKVTASA